MYLRRWRGLITKEETVCRDVQNARRPGLLERCFGSLLPQEHRRSRQNAFDCLSFTLSAWKRLKKNYGRINLPPCLTVCLQISRVLILLRGNGLDSAEA